MNTEQELKTIRYLINDLILYVYDLRVKLDELAPSKRKYTMGEPNVTGDSIKFDLFTVNKNKYKELVDKYGVDVVNEACVRLDEFIKINDYVPYKIPHLSLSRRFIKEVLFERIKKHETSND